MMTTTTNQTAGIYALKHSELVQMWIEFGRIDFANNGYQVQKQTPSSVPFLFIQ